VLIIEKLGKSCQLGLQELEGEVDEGIEDARPMGADRVRNVPAFTKYYYQYVLYEY
jgi:hypothetical protein